MNSRLSIIQMPIFRLIINHSLTFKYGNNQIKFGPYPSLTQFLNLPFAKIKKAKCAENMELIRRGEANNLKLDKIYESPIFKDDEYYIHSALFHHAGRISIRTFEFIAVYPILVEDPIFYFGIICPLIYFIRRGALFHNGSFEDLPLATERREFYQNISELRKILDGKKITWRID